MSEQTPKKKTLLCTCLVVGLTLLIGLSCGDDSNPTNNSNQGGPDRVSIPLEGALSNIQLLANQTTHIDFTLQVPPAIGVIDSVEIDVGATIPHVIIPTLQNGLSLVRMVSLMLSEESVTANVRVGNDSATVCTQGLLYGPFTISTASIADPGSENITLANPTVQLLNVGSVIICMQLFSTVDVTFSVDQVETNVVQGDCESPTNFAGVWSGTYQCGNSCGGVFGDTVHITVTQNGNTASYVDDIGDTYTGTVCGNLFRFERVDPDEIERGSLTLDDSTHATKRSTWRDTSPPHCTGNCVDILARVSGP